MTATFAPVTAPEFARTTDSRRDFAADAIVGASPASGRDSFIDLLRVFAIILVVGQHWLLPTMSFENGQMTVGNALSAAPWAPVITWLTQVMPLIFFAGGAANAISWRSAQRRGTSASSWLAARLGRLGTPVLAVAAVWIPLPYLLTALGAPADPVVDATVWIGRVLWFLPVYLIAVAATPLATKWLRRPVASLVFLGVAALCVDALRFSVAEPFGYLNMAFVWLAIHQLGVLYTNGKLVWLTVRRAVAISVGGFAATAVLVIAGPYPLLMLGLPGAGMSNHAPPTFCLLTLSAGLLGLAFALRPALTRMASVGLVDRIVQLVTPRMMSIYVWHMTALMVGAGICAVFLGLSTPAPGSALWWISAPLWTTVLLTILVGLLKVFGWAEGIRITPAGASYRPARIVASTALIGLGLLALTIAGFAMAGDGQFPTAMIATAGVALGLSLLRPAAIPTYAPSN